MACAEPGLQVNLSDRDSAAAFQRDCGRGLIHRGPVPAPVCSHLGAWVEKDDILDALLQVERGADLGVLFLVVFDQYLENGLRDTFEGLVGIRRFIAKHGKVRPSQGTIGKLDINIRELEASAIEGRSLYAQERTKNCLLMPRSRKGFPSRNAGSNFQLNPGVFSPLRQFLEGSWTTDRIGFHS